MFADEPRILTHVGPYAPPTEPLALSEGLDVVGWPRLEALRVAESFSGLVSAWSFDGVSSSWLVKDFDPRSSATSLTGSLAGGSGLWTFGDAGAAASQRRFEPTATAAQDVLFYHTDHLGSTALVTDLAGNVAEETAYYPFGVPRHEERHTAWFEGAYKFTGKERDEESGLHYHSARYYEPVIGRFVSADPLYVGRFGGAGQRLGVYAYAVNSPLSLSDPSGLDAKHTITPYAKGKLFSYGIESTVYVHFDKDTDFYKDANKGGKWAERAKALEKKLQKDFESRVKDTGHTWGNFYVRVKFKVVKDKPKLTAAQKKESVVLRIRRRTEAEDKGGIWGRCGTGGGCWFGEDEGRTADAANFRVDAKGNVQYSGAGHLHEILHGLGLPHAVAARYTTTTITVRDAEGKETKHPGGRKLVMLPGGVPEMMGYMNTPGKALLTRAYQKELVRRVLILRKMSGGVKKDTFYGSDLDLLKPGKEIHSREIQAAYDRVHPKP